MRCSLAALLDIQKLKEAVTKFLVTDANDFKTAIGEEFFDTYNPRKFSEIVYPYCVYQLLSGRMDRDSATKYEYPIFRFSLFDDAPSGARITSIAGKLDSRFDECEASLNALSMDPAHPLVLGITGVKVLNVIRISSLSNIINTGLGNWQMPVDFEIHLQRT